MRRDRGRPSDTAFHEAGHAVIATVLGAPVAFATIIPSDGAAGAVKHGRERGDSQLTRWSDKAVILFAGPVAQRRSHPKSDVRGGAADDRFVLGMMSELLFEAASHRAPFLDEAQRRARALVEQHWFAIDQVARALQAHGALGGIAVQQVIEAAQQDWAVVRSMSPGLSALTYARRRAIDARRRPPARRADIERAAGRAALAGKADLKSAIIADLEGRGFDTAAARQQLRSLAGGVS